MCGICGVVGGQLPSRVNDMLGMLAHRGPDASGLFQDANCVLGHRRLSIVDLSEAGNQPMTSAGGRFTMVANGEIYNHQPLRAELESKGYQFSSQSDCEVLLHGFAEWRDALFSRLNGMFAVAIWDATEHALYLARDRIGIKPLYYCHRDAQIEFASELKALLYPNETRQLSHAGFAQFLATQNTLGSYTLFEGIKMVEPGQWLRFCNGRCTRQTYWTPACRTRITDVNEGIEAFADAAQAAVKRHLMADVRAATYLSSGFDSGGVTALAALYSDSPVTSVTGTFGAAGWYDEATGARTIARACGVEHHLASISPEDLEHNLDDLVWALDEPRMGMGAFAQYMVARKVAQTHKFVLTGHGGDELFSGYPIFKILQAASKFKEALRILPTLRFSEFPHLAYFWPHRWQPAQKRYGVPLLFAPNHTRALLRRELYVQLDQNATTSGLAAYAAHADSDYERLLLTYLRVYLPGLLVVEDKVSMAHSLESRTPLLDNAVVDLALSISPRTKLHNGVLKAIPKAALRGYLPSAVYALPKRGFPTPLAAWLRGPLRSWFEARLDPQHSPLTALMRASALRRETSTFLTSYTRHCRPLDELGAHRMWMLLCLDAWLRSLKSRLNISVTF